MSCLDAVTETVADAVFIHLSSILLLTAVEVDLASLYNMHGVLDVRNSLATDGSVCMNYNSFLIYKSLTFGSLRSLSLKPALPPVSSSQLPDFLQRARSDLSRMSGPLRYGRLCGHVN